MCYKPIHMGDWGASLEYQGPRRREGGRKRERKRERQREGEREKERERESERAHVGKCRGVRW